MLLLRLWKVMQIIFLTIDRYKKPYGVVVFTKNSQPPLAIIYKKHFSSIFYKNIFKKGLDIIHFNDIIELEKVINCIN